MRSINELKMDQKYCSLLFILFLEPSFIIEYFPMYHIPAFFQHLFGPKPIFTWGLQSHYGLLEWTAMVWQREQVHIGETYPD